MSSSSLHCADVCLDANTDLLLSNRPLVVAPVGFLKCFIVCNSVFGDFVAFKLRLLRFSGFLIVPSRSWLWSSYMLLYTGFLMFAEVMSSESKRYGFVNVTSS
ncbi:lectin-like protein [Bufonid herpesvirus 1]|uniref:lectin-like protein n=1 Tax=Bufonid herpesvirus 1 TaxID=2282206 RepID=UPI000EB68FB0|nr:lectin-like protein [Bufonid herpesvirus 1]AXF48527.1 lectin-like protein [Bufonid herpesvirus 1]